MSKLSIGIVGLPNVGKSTLFQTLTQKQVDIANYPFATIDPNVGVVAVPDARVDALADLMRSRKKIYTAVEFVDIAGLIRGAHKGEGLGNAFLSHIREVDAIVYVLRAFKKSDIIHTEGSVDPLRDKEILETELMLKDLETVKRRLDNLEGEIRGGSKTARKEKEVFTLLKSSLESGTLPVLDEESQAVLRSYQLLTIKPRFYLLNGNPAEVPDTVLDRFEKGAALVADLAEELELSSLSPEERAEFADAHSALDELIVAGYHVLDLITFLTTGEDETRAWTVPRGARAPRAAGVIHSDFEKFFIRAEVIFWKDLINAGGYASARARGLVRTEGKEYIVKDGDVIEIRHGA
jgi:GTP-binding protein YchF